MCSFGDTGDTTACLYSLSYPSAMTTKKMSTSQRGLCIISRTSNSSLEVVPVFPAICCGILKLCITVSLNKAKVGPFPKQRQEYHPLVVEINMSMCIAKRSKLLCSYFVAYVNCVLVS